MPMRELNRALNRAKIIDIIRTAGMISRVDIARTSAYSKASVTGLTADLIKEGLIIEKESGKYEGGRRPMLLALNPEGAYVVGVNLSISKLSAVIVNLAADVIASHVMPLEPRHYEPDELADRIAAAVMACIWEADFAKHRISGVGIGLPGLVDATSGTIRFLPNYGWVNVDLRDRVQAKLNHPCFIDNSSNTLAIAEQWFGEGKGVDDFLVVTIENGVGLGMVINGRLYRGWDGTAGEFGHMTIIPDGPVCRCGNSGCVEAYAGNISILRDARKAAQEGHWTPPDSKQITYEQVLAAARGGNTTLQKMFATAGMVLGTGIAHLATLFNPAKIIITGKGVKAGKLMFDPMKEALHAGRPTRFGQLTTQIVIQRWSAQDWARGAGTLVLLELFKSPNSQLARVST